MRFRWIFSLVCVLSIEHLGYSQTNQDRAVQLSASTTEIPPSINLSWIAHADADNYFVYRKTRSASSWGSPIDILPGTNSTYTDTDISLGEAYEYKLQKTGGNVDAFGYIYSGVNYAPKENKGNVLLVVDDSYSTSLAEEIERLKIDLITDGWKVTRIDISRFETVTAVKNKIFGKYLSESISTIILLGHIPVPYSGEIVPDGHNAANPPNHTGAWPADCFYAELDGTWTDVSVNTTEADTSLNHNIIGDGKFDQSELPSDVDVELGRIDLFNMPDFSSNDTLLIQQYLDKNHAYRHGQVPTQSKGLIDDNFGGFDIATSAWRDFSAILGPSTIFSNPAVDYLTDLQSDNYLWSYGAGPGYYNSADSVITTSEFAASSIHTIFTVLVGSYFGDWNYQNNLLRAPLASQPSALASFWGGIPHWHTHHMGLGEHIGFSTKISQNNDTLYEGNFNQSTRSIHIALMGDPTLRMHVVNPPSNVTIDSIGTNSSRISWTPSSDSVEGYSVYRSNSIDGDFEKISSDILSDSFFIDHAPLRGNNVYIVKAVKLENVNSGSYYNTSQGIVDSLHANFATGIFYSDQSEFFIDVFPNPAREHLTVNIGASGTSSFTIQLYTLDGKKVLEKKTENQLQLSTTSIPNGVYFLHVISPEGLMDSRKVVIL